MDYFISDTHFSHRNIVSGCSNWEDKSGCRPFNSLDEHDGTLLDNINSVVGENDILWHLGDWSFGNSSNVSKFRSSIRCQNVVLLFGNHDYVIKRDRCLKDLFHSTADIRNLRINNQNIVMCHYPLQVWEGNNRGAWMLHGHSHNNINHDGDGKILDLAPEGHDYKPWSFDQISDYMSSRPIVAKDHHQ